MNHWGSEKVEKINKNFGIDVDGRCFPAGTLIRTPKGLRHIETFAAGDFVTSWSLRDRAWKSARVIRRIDHGARPITVICFDDGTAVKSTASHSFATAEGWKAASRIRIGEKVQGDTQAAAYKTVSGISLQRDSEPVYNLITEEFHNFVADGVLAHNFTHFRGVQMAYWRFHIWVAKHISGRNWHKVAINILGCGSIRQR